MKPVNFEAATSILAAPPGTPLGKCGGLPVRIGKSDIWPGAQSYTSYFKPTPMELEALNAGACVELEIHSLTHPPLSMGVHHVQHPLPFD